MNNPISENTKVILLLTSFFNNAELRQCKPLTVNGYGYFARWLNTYGYQPADLLQQEKLNSLFERWQQADSHPVVKQKVAFSKLDQTIRDITPTRIQTLLGRGASLSMALDKWTAAGIWILDRSHVCYPMRIKKALKDQAPAILFGIGNAELLSKPAIGFVGSRDCEPQDQSATMHYVNVINQNGFQVVSGAAKGVDSHAMLASLENGHSSIGIVADSLFKASVNKQWRDYLKKEQLVLITPFYPESKFSPADAMQRNKFIYLLSSATVVIRSGETGGTWKGAEENLKKGWVPLMVSEHKTPNYPANQKLLDGQIKNAKLQPQKITPEVSADDFIALLNAQQSQQVVQQTQENTQQGSLLGDDLFTDSTMQDKPSEFPQRPVRSLENAYAHKDEIDVSAMASLADNNATDYSGNIDNAEVVNIETVNVEQVDKKAEPELATSGKETLGDITHSNEVISDTANTAQIEKPPLSPIMAAFYKQIVELIKATPNQVISYSLLDEAFPELRIISKTALNKWIEHLVEQGYLLRPKPRKKEYCIAS